MKQEPLLLVKMSWNFRDLGYGYGATVQQIASDHIHWHTQLMPPGVTLTKWYSHTLYQAHKQTPNLPLLQHGNTYYLAADMSSQPRNSVYLHVQLFDRYQHLVKSYIFREGFGSFKFEEGTQYYEIDLINASAHQLDFYGVYLSNQPINLYGQQIACSSIAHENEDEEAFNIVFIEPKEQYFHVPDIATLYNVLYVWPRRVNNNYTNTKVAEDLRHIVKAYQDEFDIEQIRLISYGPLGQAGTQYHTQTFSSLLLSTQRLQANATHTLPSQFRNHALCQTIYDASIHLHPLINKGDVS